MSISAVNIAPRWPIHTSSCLASGVTASPSPCPGSSRSGVLKRAMQITTQTDLVGRAKTNVSGAIQKLTLGVQALATSRTLESALAKIFIEQSKHRDQRSTLAQQTVQHKMDQRIQQTMAQLEKIQERIEAERNATFWDGLVTFFKGLGAVCSAVSSVFTGPAGMAGAALLVSSIIVSYTVPGEAGKWLSLGLSVAGALCTAGATFGVEAASGGAKLAKSALTIGESLSTGTAGGCGIARGCNEHDALQAEADLVHIRAISQKLLSEAEEEREELKLLMEAQERGVQILTKALHTNHETAQSAIQGGVK